MRIPIFALAMMVAIPAWATDLQPWQTEALKLVKAEKKVVNALWKDPVMNVLHVTMKANGTRRDGYAEYLCMLFSDAGAPKDLKSIMIYGAKTYEERRQEMGMAACR